MKKNLKTISLAMLLATSSGLIEGMHESAMGKPNENSKSFTSTEQTNSLNLAVKARNAETKASQNNLASIAQIATDAATKAYQALPNVSGRLNDLSINFNKNLNQPSERAGQRSTLQYLGERPQVIRENLTFAADSAARSLGTAATNAGRALSAISNAFVSKPSEAEEYNAIVNNLRNTPKGRKAAIEIGILKALKDTNTPRTEITSNDDLIINPKIKELSNSGKSSKDIHDEMYTFAATHFNSKKSGSGTSTPTASEFGTSAPTESGSGTFAPTASEGQLVATQSSVDKNAKTQVTPVDISWQPNAKESNAKQSNAKTNLSEKIKALKEQRTNAPQSTAPSIPVISNI